MISEGLKLKKRATNGLKTGGLTQVFPKFLDDDFPRDARAYLSLEASG